MCLSNCLLKRFIFYSWTSFAQYRTKGSRLVRPKSWSTEKLKRGSTTSCPPSTQGAKRTLRMPNVNWKTHVTKSSWHGADLRKHKTNFVTVTLIHKFVIWMTWIVIKKNFNFTQLSLFFFRTRNVQKRQQEFVIFFL